MVQAAHSSQLKAGFEEHLQQTQGHVTRLEQIFEKLARGRAENTARGWKGFRPKAKSCFKKTSTRRFWMPD